MLTKLQDTIQQDYVDLCGALCLHPLPLDIYVVVDGSTDRTEFGTEFRNGTPAYNGHLIVLPVELGDLDMVGVPDRTFPPSNFERGRWQAWRVDLWHETTHQVQDQLLHLFDRNDGSYGHTIGWREAVQFAASALGTTTDVFGRLVRRAF